MEHGVDTTLEVMEASEEHVRLRVTSSMRLAYAEWGEASQRLADTLETGIRPIPRPRPPMNERQAKALAFVRQEGMITLGTYRAICPYYSDETLRLDLANLVRRGLLTKNGARKGTYYTLAA